MKVRYLLDTNVVSDLVHEPGGSMARRVEAFQYGEVATSIMVAAEIRYGVVKRRSKRLALQVENVLSGLHVAPIVPPFEVRYGDIRVELEVKGQPIGGNDLIIAAHALALDAVLVTRNLREFVRVPGLKVENWHEKA